MSPGEENQGERPLLGELGRRLRYLTPYPIRARDTATFSLSSPGDRRTTMDVLRRQRRNYRDRPTVFVELEREPGSLRRLLETFRANEVIYLTGDPFSTLELEEWLQEPLPPGWRHGAHYLQLPHPVLRFEEPTDHGLWRVEIHRAAAYFGEGDYSPSDAMIAWHRLGALLAGSFDEGRLLATPATTGRYLIGRSIPFAREWPLLEVETQELLRSTSGQDRKSVV